MYTTWACLKIDEAWFPDDVDSHKKLNSDGAMGNRPAFKLTEQWSHGLLASHLHFWSMEVPLNLINTDFLWNLMDIVLFI